MPLNNPVILQDGTEVARGDSKANVTWNRWYHTLANALQALVASASSGATAALAGPVTGSVQTPAGVALTVKYAKFSTATTDGVVVAAVATKKIRVLQLAYSCTVADTTVVFNSKGAGAGTAISNIFYNKLETFGSLAPSDNGWFETTAGEGLSVTATTGTAAGVVTYVEIA